MGKIWMQLVKSGLLSLVALVVLEILIWFGGEYFEIHPKTRALIALIVLVVWGILFVLQRVLAARTAKLLEQRLGADAQSQLQTVAPGMRGEVEQLERNLREAIQTLKRSQLGGAALYALPWYIIIGPPGAGKSTALLESGLTFPSVGGARRSIRGVGGTRNCDWWFTDQGILLDTAGRYTTESEDHDEWLSFLDMLRKSRKHKPINGVIVAIAISDLMGQSDVDIEHHAENIRARLDELAERLQLVFPVYLLFTKCDLLSGFTSFFEDLGRAERAVVWGATFPFGSQGAGKSMQARFDEEFATLYRGLIARRTGLLAVERPQAKKAGIFQFPVQLALAQNRLSHFVGSLFRPNPYQESCLLRGFYFTSGTQEGAPIDQIMNAMSRAFGLSGGSSEQAAPVLEKKSYFLNHLFTKVIFPDQGLARSSASAEKSRRLLRMAGLIGFPSAALVMLVLLLVAFFRDHGLIGRVEDVVGKLKEAPRVASLKESLEPLDTLRREIEQVRQRPASGSMGLRWGKRTSADLGSSLNRAWFDRAATRLLVPVVDKLRETAEALIKTTEPMDAAACARLSDLVLADEMVGDKRRFDEELLGRVLLDHSLWPADAAGIEARVDEQLRFYLELWKSSSGAQRTLRPWTEVDTRRCDAARVKLEQRWPIAVYEDEMGKQRKELHDIDRDRLAGSHLVIADSFSKAFTPGEWTRRVKSLLQTTARVLWGSTDRLGIKLTEAELLERLTDQYKTQYRENWLGLLRRTKLREDGKLRDVVVRNQDLVDKESQLIAFFTEVRAQQQLDLSGDGKQVFNAPTEDLAPLRAVLDALGPLQKELRLLVRSDATLLGALETGQLKTVASKVAEAFDTLDPVKTDKPYSEALRRIMDASLRQVVEQLRVSAKVEADALWQKGVAATFAAQSSQFPFVDDLGAADVKLVDLSAFLNGKSGTLWAIDDQLTRLHAIRVNDAPLVVLSAAHNGFIARMTAIRGAFYATRDREDRAVYPFQINLGRTDRISDVRFRVCKSANEIVHSKLANINKPEPVEWSQACCLGTTMEIKASQVSEKWWTAAGQKPESEWGLFRLVRSATVKAEPPGRVVNCDLKFPTTNEVLAQDLRAFLVLNVEDYQKSPFHPGFFVGITCPPGACE